MGPRQRRGPPGRPPLPLRTPGSWTPDPGPGSSRAASLPSPPPATLPSSLAPRLQDVGGSRSGLSNESGSSLALGQGSQARKEAPPCCFNVGRARLPAASLKRRPFPNTWPDRIRIPGEQPDGGGGGRGGLAPHCLPSSTGSRSRALTSPHLPQMTLHPPPSLPPRGHQCLTF